MLSSLHHFFSRLFLKRILLLFLLVPVLGFAAIFVYKWYLLSAVVAEEEYLTVFQNGVCVASTGELIAVEDASTSVCKMARTDFFNRKAIAACLGLQPFIKGDFSFPSDILLADVLARRFAINELSDQWQRYELILQSSDDAQLRVFQRLGDAAARVDRATIESLEGMDAYTSPALHCLSHPLPEDFYERLNNALAAGRYETAHVLLAIIFLKDIGCEINIEADFMEAVLSANAALIDENHTLLTDLEMEAAAFLSYSGQANRIPEGFLEAVLSQQLPSGGWKWATNLSDDSVNGHTSSLALWYLLENLFPGRKTPMVSQCVRSLNRDESEERDNDDDLLSVE